jgi:hypothetical protein
VFLSAVFPFGVLLVIDVCRLPFGGPGGPWTLSI